MPSWYLLTVFPNKEFIFYHFIQLSCIYTKGRSGVLLFIMQRKRRSGKKNAGSSSKLQCMIEDSTSEGSEFEPFSLSDAGLTTLAKGCTRLEKLSLIWCSNVTSAGLYSIAENCRTLKSLDLQVGSLVADLDTNLFCWLSWFGNLVISFPVFESQQCTYSYLTIRETTILLHSFFFYFLLCFLFPKFNLNS